MKIIFATIIFCLLLSSCIKEVDLSLGQLPQKLVVNGLICPDSLFKVRVSLSSNMDAEKELIDNAIIKVYKDGIYSTTLAAIGDGWYQGTYPTEEIQYRIEVFVPQFEMVYAETSIPKFPEIIDTFYEKLNSPPDDAGFIHAKTTIVFQDDPNQLNYYQTKRVYYYNDQPQEIDPSILTDGDLNYNPLFLYFSDALFNGENKTLTVMGGGSISQSPFGDDYIYYQKDYKRDFGPVSEEYYLGVKSWTQHYFNQSNDSDINDPLTLLFVGEPTAMYTNIKGGYGVFAGYHFKELEIGAHE